MERGSTDDIKKAHNEIDALLIDGKESQLFDYEKEEEIGVIYDELMKS